MSEPIDDIENAIERASDYLHNSQQWESEGVYADVIAPALDRARAEIIALRKDAARFVVDDAMVGRAAKVLVKRHALQCGVDERDVWTIYGDEFREDARAALDAALAVQP